MQAKDLWYIAKTLYAMEQKRKKPDIGEQMHNERYQRTMSDEYPWRKPSKGRLEPVSDEQREAWRKFHER